MVRYLWQRIGTPLGNERGAVLLITIFVIALVTILVLEYHYDAAVEIELAETHANDAKAYHLAIAGLNFARAILANDTNAYDAPNELWHNLEAFGCIAPSDLLTIAQTFIESQVKLGEDAPESPSALESADSESALPACVALKIVDENRKLPINRILDESDIETYWAGIATLLLEGVWDGEESRDLPADAIGAIMDWIDQGDGNTRGGGVGGEDDYYQTLEPPYKTPGRNIEVPGELRMIRFFTCERLAKFFDDVECSQIPNTDLGNNLYFSTFDHERININTAHPSILLAMTNSETCIEEIETQRTPADDQPQLLAEPFKEDTDVDNLACLQESVTDLPELQTKVQTPNAPDPDPYIPGDSLGISSTYFRVESQAIIDGQINKKVVAVFYREPGSFSDTSGDNASDDDREPPKMVYFKIE